MLFFQQVMFLSLACCFLLQLCPNPQMPVEHIHTSLYRGDLSGNWMLCLYILSFSLDHNGRSFNCAFLQLLLQLQLSNFCNTGFFFLSLIQNLIHFMNQSAQSWKQCQQFQTWSIAHNLIPEIECMQQNRKVYQFQKNPLGFGNSGLPQVRTQFRFNSL